VPWSVRSYRHAPWTCPLMRPSRCRPQSSSARACTGQHRDSRKSGLPPVSAPRLCADFCTVSRRPPGRTGRRHGAHACAPATAAPTPVGWRESMKSVPLKIQQVSSVRAGQPLLPLPGLSGSDQNLSSPSVTVGQPHPSSCLANVHAKTALTEPARTRSWQLSEAGTRVARNP
jgi:hypothetical protein